MIAEEETPQRYWAGFLSLSATICLFRSFGKQYSLPQGGSDGESSGTWNGLQ
jgi:hypothetical protein